MEENAVFESIRQQVQEANPILGGLVLENFKSLTEMPQGHASAWTAVEKLVGAGYKPLLCAAKQQAKGTNYWFIAEQTFITKTPERHIVTIGVNEFNGVYAVMPGSITRIF